MPILTIKKNVAYQQRRFRNNKIEKNRLQNKKPQLPYTIVWLLRFDFQIVRLNYFYQNENLYPTPKLML